MSRLGDRQATAAIGGFLGLCLAVPVVVLLGSVIATGWAAALGAHDVHGTVWGWLSYRRDDGTWGIGNIVWEYFLGVVSAYIGYQLLEVLGGCFRAFRRALT